MIVVVNDHVDIKLQENFGTWHTEKITNMHEKKGRCKQQRRGRIYHNKSA